jgi:hypothetical protein
LLLLLLLLLLMPAAVLRGAHGLAGAGLSCAPEGPAQLLLLLSC